VYQRLSCAIFGLFSWHELRGSFPFGQWPYATPAYCELFFLGARLTSCTMKAEHRTPRLPRNFAHLRSPIPSCRAFLDQAVQQVISSREERLVTILTLNYTRMRSRETCVLSKAVIGCVMKPNAGVSSEEDQNCSESA
jgi:hypothetical protein